MFILDPDPGVKKAPDPGSGSATLTRTKKSYFIFSVEHEPELGRYDLRIKNATYERDNGNFECRKVQSGTGKKLHSSTVDLVVLLPPSPPILSPVSPTLTEGKAFNLSCASIGGSPPPEILWYRLDAADSGNADEDQRGGQQQVRDSVTYLPGRSRNEPTMSVLSIMPRKEDDGSEYRCTVWNRAIEESELMEASTTIDVNCKYMANVHRTGTSFCTVTLFW